MDSINERFREARKRLGISQDEFARAATRTRSEISNIEYGKTVPKEEVIQSVCKAHGISEVWLRTGEGEMFLPKSRKEELMDIFGSALNGVTDKDRFIRAVSQIPDEAFPAFVQFLKTLSEEFQK